MLKRVSKLQGELKEAEEELQSAHEGMDLVASALREVQAVRMNQATALDRLHDAHDRLQATVGGKKKVAMSKLSAVSALSNTTKSVTFKGGS